MDKALTEVEYKDLAEKFRRMNEYGNATDLANKCELRSQELKNERFHIVYTNASTEMHRLKKIKTRDPEYLHKLANEWNAISSTLSSVSDYKDASKLSETCNQKFIELSAQAEKYSKKAKQKVIHKEKTRKILASFGLFLQIGFMLAFFYVLFFTDIIRNFAKDFDLFNISAIASESYSPNGFSSVILNYILMLTLPIGITGIIIGLFRLLFGKKKKGFKGGFWLIALTNIVYSIFVATEIFNYPVAEQMWSFMIGLFIVNTIVAGVCFVLFSKKKTALFATLLFSMIMVGLFLGWIGGNNYYEKKEYSDGIAAVRKGNFLNRRWGFIDESGKVVIPYIYSDALSFSEGLAAVWNGKWGFIDTNGEVIVPFKYNAVASFSDGMAAVRIGNTKQGKWGLIDKTGKEVVSCKYESIGVFSQGLVKVQKEGLWGFIDKTGNEIVSLKYFEVSDFSEGLAAVRKSNSFTEERGVGRIGRFWGFIDMQGNEIIPEKFYRAGNFKGGLAVVAIGSNLGWKWGVINRSGREIIRCDYERISINEGIIEAKINNQEIHYFNKSGNIINR